MQKMPAAALAATCVVVSQLCGKRYSPTPGHPRTAIWYASLRKPSFTPPGAVFAVVWTGLDALLGYSGYRLMIAPSGRQRSLALGAWATNVAGVAGFSYVLFGRKRLDQALEVTLGMVGSSVAAVATAAPVDRSAAWSVTPLAAWVSFAALLQEEVWRRNR
ncbi:MAG: TspO/MBR family protein [Janthinobacterium lividum]